jgi:hypothetical protein
MIYNLRSDTRPATSAYAAQLTLLWTRPALGRT